MTLVFGTWATSPALVPLPGEWPTTSGIAVATGGSLVATARTTAIGGAFPVV
jgi:hypothetical protein